jgi:hypothetical protein
VAASTTYRALTPPLAFRVIGGRKYYVTIRYGLVEIVEGEPLLGTPAPMGRFEVSEETFRKIALRVSGSRRLMMI